MVAQATERRLRDDHQRAAILKRTMGQAGAIEYSDRLMACPAPQRPQQLLLWGRNNTPGKSKSLVGIPIRKVAATLFSNTLTGATSATITAIPEENNLPILHLPRNQK